MLTVNPDTSPQWSELADRVKRLQAQAEAIREAGQKGIAFGAEVAIEMTLGSISPFTLVVPRTAALSDIPQLFFKTASTQRPQPGENMSKVPLWWRAVDWRVEDEHGRVLPGVINNYVAPDVLEADLPWRLVPVLTVHHHTRTTRHSFVQTTQEAELLREMGFHACTRLRLSSRSRAHVTWGDGFDKYYSRPLWDRLDMVAQANELMHDQRIELRVAESKVLTVLVPESGQMRIRVSSDVKLRHLKRFIEQAHRIPPCRQLLLDDAGDVTELKRYSHGDVLFLFENTEDESAHPSDCAECGEISRRLDEPLHECVTWATEEEEEDDEDMDQ